MTVDKDIMKIGDEDIARIGFFGKNQELEVYVATYDIHPYPHFHIRDRGTLGTMVNVSVAFESAAHYMPHGNATQYLTEEQAQELYDFMCQPCRNPHFENNYEYAVEMWNMNNSVEYRMHYDKNSKTIIVPDYARMAIRKVVVKQALRDNYDCDRVQFDGDINPLFYNLTKKFLHSNSELMRLLLAKFHYLPWCRLILRVEFEDEHSLQQHKGFIKSIRLTLSDVQPHEGGFGSYMDDERHKAFNRMAEIDKVLADYFKSIGLQNIAPNNVEEMEAFLTWFEKELPIIRDYFEVDNYLSEDFEQCDQS